MAIAGGTQHPALKPRPCRRHAHSCVMGGRVEEGRGGVQYLLEVVADGVRAACHQWDILTRSRAGCHLAAPGRPLCTKNQGHTRAPMAPRALAYAHQGACGRGQSLLLVRPRHLPHSRREARHGNAQSQGGNGRRCSFRPPLDTRRARCTAPPSARSAGHECYSPNGEPKGLTSQVSPRAARPYVVATSSLKKGS